MSRLEPVETLAAAPGCGVVSTERGARGESRAFPPSRRATLREATDPWHPDAEPAIAFLTGRKSIARYRSDSGSSARQKVLRWLGGEHDVYTRTGKSLRSAVAGCGTLFAARQGGELGVAHRWCRTRICPGCMKRRQAKYARILQRWVRERIDDAGAGDKLFVTLTQVKQAIEHETAGQALTRVHNTRRETWNTKKALGRDLRDLVAGGVFFTEMAWSYQGKPRKDGSRVAYSGWHAHLHGIVEIVPPPHGWPPARWRKHVAAAIVDAWLETNPEASRAAQHVELLASSQIGQVCKYPLKPFDYRDAARQREACLALAGRRTHDAFGTWRSWVAEGEALLAQEEEPRPPIELGDVSLHNLQRRAEWGARVYFEVGGEKETEGVDAAAVLRAIAADPRSFQRRAAEQRQAEREAREASPSHPRASPAGPRAPPDASSCSPPTDRPPSP